jgi:hypothetical protein
LLPGWHPSWPAGIPSFLSSFSMTIQLLTEVSNPSTSDTSCQVLERDYHWDLDWWLNIKHFNTWLIATNN